MPDQAEQEERVARAIVGAAIPDSWPEKAKMIEDGWDQAIPEARAAIAALAKEPGT